MVISFRRLRSAVAPLSLRSWPIKSSHQNSTISLLYLTYAHTPEYTYRAQRREHRLKHTAQHILSASRYHRQHVIERHMRHTRTAHLASEATTAYWHVQNTRRRWDSHLDEQVEVVETVLCSRSQELSHTASGSISAREYNHHTAAMRFWKHSSGV